MNISGKNLWVVRHGLRADFCDPDWVNSAEEPYNSPLAEEGFEQAGETALCFMNKTIDHIFSSPFLRTIQTAHIIAEKIDKMVNVEYGLSEWLRPKDFDFQPELNSLEELKSGFSSINTHYASIVRPGFPEDRKALDERTAQTLSGILENYDGNILIITHASPIQAIQRVLLHVDPQDYQSMCSISHFRLTDGEWSLSVDGDSSHLTNPDKTRRAFYREV